MAVVTPAAAQTRLATAGLTRENSVVRNAPSFLQAVSLSILMNVPSSMP